MIPVPEKVQQLLRGSPGGSFGLFFHRMWEWRWKGEEALEKLPALHESWVKRQAAALPGMKPLLERCHRRQESFLKFAESQGGIGVEVRAKLASPFVSGLGAGHPSETGLVLDRNTGCVYLPAPSIKGSLKNAWTAELMRGLAGTRGWSRDEDVEKALEGERLPVVKEKEGYMADGGFAGLQEWFGSVPPADYEAARRDPQGTGRLVVLDAFPVAGCPLEVDILNPHHGDYYMNKGEAGGPVDSRDPVPVNFWRVPAGEAFVFRFALFPRPLLEEGAWTEERKEELKEALLRIWSLAANQGFGGKTSL